MADGDWSAWDSSGAQQRYGGGGSDDWNSAWTPAGGHGTLPATSTAPTGSVTCLWTIRFVRLICGFPLYHRIAQYEATGKRLAQNESRSLWSETAVQLMFISFVPTAFQKRNFGGSDCNLAGLNWSPTCYTYTTVQKYPGRHIFSRFLSECCFDECK